MVPWRRSRLRHAGFGADLVSELAEDLRYDLPTMLELIDRGCPPHLAVRIVAPLVPWRQPLQHLRDFVAERDSRPSRR